MPREFTKDERKLIQFAYGDGDLCSVEELAQWLGYDVDALRQMLGLGSDDLQLTVSQLIERTCAEAQRLGVKCDPPETPTPSDAIDFVADLLRKAGEREDLSKMPYLTVEQAATYLQVSKDKIYDLCKSGELPHKMIGRIKRIKRTDLDQLSTEEDDW